MIFGTKGTMQVDYEDRIDFNRMREYREGRIQKFMAETDFSCLILFATENKRYATSTAVASPEVDNMGRYAIVPRGGKPYIFGFGSEVANERINCSWIADRAYPAHTTMFGALPASWGVGGHLDNFEKDLRMVLEENHLDPRDPIGVDRIDGQLLTDNTKRGFKNQGETDGLAFAHGLGVCLWERPMIERSFSLEHPVELKEGMVIAIETYDGEGHVGARIEDELVITKDGPLVISKFPRDTLLACPIL